LEESSSRNQLVKTDSDSPSLNNQSEIDLQQMSESVFGTGPALKTKLQLNCEQSENNFNVKKFVNKWLTLNGFLHEVYIPTLRKPIAKVIGNFTYFYIYKSEFFGVRIIHLEAF